jgi:hypothetical protein
MMKVRKKKNQRKMTPLKINSTIRVSVTEDWRIVFKYQHKKWDVKVSTINGVVFGGPNDNVAIDNMDYFSFPDDVREKHFQKFKEAIMAQKQKQ